jgi:WD40 repeat protein
MVERNSTIEIIDANERALRSLERALALSNGQFSVVLVCCNYTVLRELMLQQLAKKGWGNEKIHKVIVPHNALSLYTPIHFHLTQQPAALMVLGLESVAGLDDLLSSVNHVRDEFRKRHPFPMIIWVNDEILQKILRLAPDFASWAATPIRFDMTANSLLEFLHQETNSLFSRVLHYNTTQSQQITNHYSTLEQVWVRSYELHFAIKELQNRGIEIEAELNASLEFVFGLDDYVSDRINDALKHFQLSWQFWQQFENIADPRQLGEEWQNWDIVYFSLPPSSSPSSPSPSPHLLKKGILLLYVGLSYCRLADQNQTANHQHWQAAKTYFQQCLQTFQTAGRIDLVSEYIVQLIEVLQCLQAWDELQAVAENALEIHQNYGNHIQLACDYGFLAHAATQKSHWMQASILAHVALLKLGEAQNSGENYNHLFPLLLAQIYYLTLAKAQQKLNQSAVAQEYLEKAKQELNAALESSEHQYDAHRYIRLLRTLRSLYFEAGCYLEAYIIRQKRRSIEQQYGFRAFIGAGRLQPQRQATNPALMSTSVNSSIALEIVVSGREGDINNLIGRISRSDQKLTVIHGPSGVGKSSTVSAGLVPALQNRAIGDQIAVPVVLQVYTDWVKELGKALIEATAQISLPTHENTDKSISLSSPITIAGILQQLRFNADNDLITVLVFDQFEEFFFGHTDREQKQAFDQFICDCLNISFVKVILSLREDYLHRLLDFTSLSALETVNNNILDKNIRYKLNNFSPDYARALIQKLTERSQLHLEPALIDALVQDLSAELGEVRPIELQVVGAQIQDERITTLTQYQPYRPNKLIERYLKELIQDCGSENERAALLVLYLLTDESKKRPFKTRSELAAELTELEETAQLELILDILVRSGLVVLFPDVPERYQLIHDYLVDLIRYLQQQESSLQAQLNQLRYKVEGSQKEIERLKSELRQSKQQVTLVDTTRQQGVDLLTELRELRKREEISQLEIEQLRAELKEKELTTQLAKSQEQQRLSEVKLNRTLKIALSFSVATIFGLTISVINVINSEIKTISTSSEALFASQKGVDALKESIKAGRKLQTTIWVDASTKQQVLTSLYQSIYGVKERNRLEKHSSGVNSVAFSPDQTLIASASGDSTINLWWKNGRWIKTLKGHEDAINNVKFSPSSKMIVSASQDETVKVWNLQGENLVNLKGHKSVVNSASFSPDEQIIASASTDKTVKLWQRDGKFIKDLIDHKQSVLDVAWSPDGKVLASASADKTIKLWSREGKLLQTLPGHKDGVKSVAWSPDGKYIASGSLDQTIKLWNREGKLLQTLSGHSNFITSVAFSPDSKTIASSSADETVKIWTVQGALLDTLRGHNNWVNSASFSPDGKTIASASRDKTVKLWHWDNTLLLRSVNEEDGITSISYSPDSQMVVTGNKDNSIKFWNREGKLLKKIPAHKDQVWGVAWSPDGKYIASASRDATIKLWSKDGQELKTLKGHEKTVLAVAWSPDSKFIASAGKDQTVRLWNREGKLLKTFKGHTDVVNWVSFSHDGKLLASASDDTKVKIWTRDGNNHYNLTGHTQPIYGVTWSPNDQTIASVSVDSTVKLWSRDGHLQKSLSGDGDGFIGVTWSPDGKTFATNSNEKVKLWSQDGTLLIALKGDQDGKLTSVSFSPDGKILAVGSDRGYIILRKIADIQLKSLLDNACNLIKDYLQHNSKVTSSDRSLCDTQKN